MARQYKNGKCSCWKKLDAELEKQEAGTELDITWSFTGRTYLKVATVRVDGKRKSPVSVIASHCPFCGAKLKTVKGGVCGQE